MPAFSDAPLAVAEAMAVVASLICFVAAIISFTHSPRAAQRGQGQSGESSEAKKSDEVCNEILQCEPLKMIMRCNDTLRVLNLAAVAR